MDCRPEFAAEKAFVSDFSDEVPELQTAWDTYVDESDEFLPGGAMYDLARGMVTLAEKAAATENTHAKAVLKRAFAYLERGMQAREVGPIPNLIRTTMCGWLGRQSSQPRAFQVMLDHMVPRLKYWLVLTDDTMPFRDGTDPLGTPAAAAALKGRHPKHGSH